MIPVVFTYVDDAVGFLRAHTFRRVRQHRLEDEALAAQRRAKLGPNALR